MKDRTDNQNPSVDRRKFFRSAGLGAIGASASLVITPIPGNSQSNSDDRKKRAGRYRLTRHVRQAYRLARF